MCGAAKFWALLSVLTRAILGLVPVRSGTISVFGRDVAKLNKPDLQALERRFGVLFQQGALFSALTVKQNIQVPMREYLGLSQQLMDQLAMLKLDLVGLSRDAADKFPSELSVFMVTHDLDSLYTACDRVAALGAGKIILEGPISMLESSNDPWLHNGHLMETRANYALIGAFTLAVIAAAFLFVFWFSGGSKSVGLKNYQVIFSGSVSGLSRGSYVLFNGLRVGDVQQIDLMLEDPSRVAALISINSRTPIKTDTRARLEFAGLTGVASIALTGGTATAPPIVEPANGGPPIIFADRSDLQNLLESVQNLSTKADAVLAKADKVFGDNADSIRTTVKNVEDFSQALASNKEGINSFLKGVGDLGTSMGPLANKFGTLSGDIDVLVKSINPDELREIVAHVNDFASVLGDNKTSFQQIIKNTQDLTGKLNATADKLDGMIAGINGVVSSPEGKGMFGDVADAARSIRTLADNLDKRTADMTTGINRFTGPGLRDLESLTGEARRSLNEVNRSLRSLQLNPQQFLLGAKPALPEYKGN
eukprot:gene13366-13481_t